MYTANATTTRLDSHHIDINPFDGGSHSTTGDDGGGGGGGGGRGDEEMGVRHASLHERMQTERMHFVEPTIVRFRDTARANSNFIILTCIALSITTIVSTTVNDILVSQFQNLLHRALVVLAIVFLFILWATLVSMHEATQRQRRARLMLN